MTEKFKTCGIREVDHSTFGGIIYPSDFNTDYRGKNNTDGSPIAKRIISNQKFDEYCRQNSFIRQNGRNEK